MQFLSYDQFIDFVHYTLFFSESRVTILPAILRHLRYHIKNRDDILDKSLNVLGSVLTNLHDQDQVNI